MRVWQRHDNRSGKMLILSHAHSRLEADLCWCNSVLPELVNSVEANINSLVYMRVVGIANLLLANSLEDSYHTWTVLNESDQILRSGPHPLTTGWILLTN